MYTLYGYPKTRSVRIAWALEEIGLPYDYKVIDLKAGEHLSDEYKAISPAAKIPVLTTPEGTLTESAAIVTFLAERHGMYEFIPEAGSFDRAKYEEMMLFLTSELEQPIWNLAKHTFALPKEQRLEQMRDVAVWEFKRVLPVFSSMLGDKEFVCGSMFTMSDVIAGHILAWAKGSKLDLTLDGKLENISVYAQRVLSREAYERAWRKEMAQIAEN
ncbi:glutathione S-transferase family protein [Alteromonas gracilis]|uniref:Glutathione S-transferase family protein n=1 Tax=Alteromonas gracilis TaxID=1479524 RepID=A0ABX5CWK1_9ALTE|nr:glutathione S-transferase family protein [Alteromonas gracilis]PRO70651.1 glutathione S-transferase family protein [Alteromonas gracilis]